MSDYPREEQLETIRNWDFSKKSIQSFLECIHQLWHWADGPGWHGYDLTGKKVLKLSLHTGGWSGNESIIDALQDNFTFWILCWEKSARGGHYCFRIDLKNFEKCREKEKIRHREVAQAWYRKAKTEGRFKHKEKDTKKLKPEKVQKKCLRCRKMYEGILGKGDSGKWGICPHCKTLQSYSFNEDDFGVGIPGVEG